MTTSHPDLDGFGRELAPDLRRLGVHPRFRARRIAVRKAAGRRRLKRLLVLVGVAATALAAVVVLRSPILDVDAVQVQGTSRVDVDEIRARAGVDPGEPLLLADLGAAATAVEALPWVAEAEVTRDLPDAVVVRVTERTPAAVVAGGGRTVLVDADGHVLDTVAGSGASYVPVFVGDAPPEPGAVVADQLVVGVDLASQLRADPPDAVASVHLEPSLHLRLTGGARVELGDAERLQEKVEAFRTLYARVDTRCLARVDLRVPTHPVVTRGAC